MSTNTDPTNSKFADLIEGLAHQGRAAQRVLALKTSAEKANALLQVAETIREQRSTIISANAQDIAAAVDGDLSPAMIDRLRLDDARLEGIAAAIGAVAQLPDPVAQVIDESEQPNGLRMRRIRVPIGLIGIIYESRPNVTADAAALCVRSGNAALLRGGSEAAHSNRAIHAAFAEGLARAGLSSDIVQLVPTQDRAAVGAMLRASGLIDMIVPRGGKSLVDRVQKDARVPVLAHLDGVCHTYVHSAADPDMAEEIVLNAKMRRTGICGAMETLLIDEGYSNGPELVGALLDAGCEIRGDATTQAFDPRVTAATDADWDTEYLDAIVSVAVVQDIEHAMGHIARHSSSHTEAIVTQDQSAAEQFLSEVDSAIVMHNASTQFADGGEFGLGAEIGIATGRLHARGPVALEGLTTYKWQVRGTGQARPA